MKQMPLIQKYMTAMPHTIGPKISIQVAQNLMREHHIRHLPVLDAGELVGVITDRDVKLASAFADAHRLTVDEVMSQDPYSVLPESPLNQVVAEMAEKKFGCAIIQQSNGKIVGIFTAVDALRVFSDTLNEFYKHGAETATHARPTGQMRA